MHFGSMQYSLLKTLNVGSNFQNPGPDISSQVPNANTSLNFIKWSGLSRFHQSLSQQQGKQEDAEEFLSCLLNGFHDEMIGAIEAAYGRPKVEGQWLLCISSFFLCQFFELIVMSSHHQTCLSARTLVEKAIHLTQIFRGMSIWFRVPHNSDLSTLCASVLK